MGQNSITLMVYYSLTKRVSKITFGHKRLQMGQKKDAYKVCELTVMEIPCKSH